MLPGGILSDGGVRELNAERCRRALQAAAGGGQAQLGYKMTAKQEDFFGARAPETVRSAAAERKEPTISLASSSLRSR
jgi:hypothetical protein